MAGCPEAFSPKSVGFFVWVKASRRRRRGLFLPASRGSRRTRSAISFKVYIGAAARAEGAVFRIGARDRRSGNSYRQTPATGSRSRLRCNSQQPHRRPADQRGFFTSVGLESSAQRLLDLLAVRLAHRREVDGDRPAEARAGAVRAAGRGRRRGSPSAQAAGACIAAGVHILDGDERARRLDIHRAVGQGDAGPRDIVDLIHDAEAVEPTGFGHDIGRDDPFAPGQGVGAVAFGQPRVRRPSNTYSNQ